MQLSLIGPGHGECEGTGRQKQSNRPSDGSDCTEPQARASVEPWVEPREAHRLMSNALFWSAEMFH